MLFRGIDHFVICYHLHYHNIVSLVGLDFYYKSQIHANYTLISAPTVDQESLDSQTATTDLSIWYLRRLLSLFEVY